MKRCAQKRRFASVQMDRVVCCMFPNSSKYPAVSSSGEIVRIGAYIERTG
jgi:hypothetical protein